MRLVLFLNNWGGWQLAKWLRSQNEDIAAVVVQPENDQRFAPEILRALALPADRIYLGPQLRNSETVAALNKLQPDLGISGWFGFILKPELLQIFPKGCINTHPAYLPWNRGWHTNVWPILDGSPAGVTVHYIDPGVDTGDIIAQAQIPVDWTDTGGSLHEKLTRELIGLFKRAWPSIRAGTAPRLPQNHSLATVHRKSELPTIDQIDLTGRSQARSFLNLLRARTYPPYPSAYYMEKGEKVFVRVELQESSGGSAQRPSAGPDTIRIDLDREYPVAELLNSLVRVPASGQTAAYFVDGAREIGVHAHYLKAGDLNPSANPPWMT